MYKAIWYSYITLCRARLILNNEVRILFINSCFIAFTIYILVVIL